MKSGEEVKKILKKDVIITKGNNDVLASLLIEAVGNVTTDKISNAMQLNPKEFQIIISNNIEKIINGDKIYVTGGSLKGDFKDIIMTVKPKDNESRTKNYKSIKNYSSILITSAPRLRRFSAKFSYPRSI